MRRIDPDEPEIYGLSATDQLPVFVDQHREMLAQSLDGLTEAEGILRARGSRHDRDGAG